MSFNKSRLAGGALRSLVLSARETIREIGSAVKARDLARMGALLREGSPLEKTITDLLYCAFIVLLVAPIVLAPAYFFLLTLAG